MKFNSSGFDNRLLSLTEVLDIFPGSKTAWHKGVKEGRYPASMELSPGIIGWREAEVEELFVRMIEGREDFPPLKGSRVDWYRKVETTSARLREKLLANDGKVVKAKKTGADSPD